VSKDVILGIFKPHKWHWEGNGHYRCEKCLLHKRPGKSPERATRTHHARVSLYSWDGVAWVNIRPDCPQTPPEGV